MDKKTICRIILRMALVAIVAAGASAAFAAGKAWKIAIVTDTKQDFAVKTKDGFIAEMDSLLAKRGESAVYSVYDTELSTDKAAQILASLRELRPDLAFTVNYPTAFADLNITAKLRNSGLRFVSSNCVPVQTGVAASWERPGGNVTGVSIFLRFNSEIKLMRLIRPEANKLVAYSWNAMTQVNDCYAGEMRRACKEEGVELVEFGLVSSAEEEFKFLERYANMGSSYFCSGLISAWVHDDGSPADMVKLEGEFFRQKMRIPSVSYDENAVIGESLAGACVIWSDIGAQAAEKGLKILDGADPGSMPWEYPRSYNILLNLAIAKSLGIAFPQSLVNAAYRVYTDLDGHFAGQAN
jgi:putative tryptophan/tyrosine transport system substrate-binding protein